MLPYWITTPSLESAYHHWWHTLPLSELQKDTLSALLSSYIQKLVLNNSPDILIFNFCQMMATHMIQQDNWIPESEIDPLLEGDVISYDTLTDARYTTGKTAAASLAILKLNGGLGTTMGCSGPKSLIPVHGTETFIDIISKQIHTLRKQTGHSIPLILLNSFNTSDATLAHLKETPILELFQHEVPRIDTESGKPYVCHKDKNLEWYPPGHGDLYLSLITSGLLDKLLAKNIRYLFVSNADNLGATADLRLLGHMHHHNLPFMMEVTPKTLSDIKGGTLIRHKGRVSLLERAQVSPEFIGAFEDISRFTVFNTNSVWLNLSALKQRLAEGPLSLPVIVNPKQVHGTHVIQLEQALGAAIEAFPGASAISVSRDRFIPVKTTADLLLLQSDYYTKRSNGTISPTGATPPTIVLSHHFKTIEAYTQRIVYPPSLKKAQYVRLDGDITVLGHVKFEGHVHIQAANSQHVVLEKRVFSNCHIQIDGKGKWHESAIPEITD